MKVKISWLTCENKYFVLAEATPCHLYKQLSILVHHNQSSGDEVTKFIKIIPALAFFLLFMSTNLVRYIIKHF